MPPQVNQELEDTIEKIAVENKVLALGLTIQQIQVMVKTQLGFAPSTSTVTRVLRRLGIDTTSGGKHRWQWGRK